ncbi:hypothetical protein C4553_01290 [Candidatus Parcubacteria bacterium]|nr:MAG: hypothetical protein C4553_01290 [Candidatus Parcubacteria bacterium]
MRVLEKLKQDGVIGIFPKIVRDVAHKGKVNYRKAGAAPPGEQEESNQAQFLGHVRGHSFAFSGTQKFYIIFSA